MLNVQNTFFRYERPRLRISKRILAIIKHWWSSKLTVVGTIPCNILCRFTYRYCPIHRLQSHATFRCFLTVERTPLHDWIIQQYTHPILQASCAVYWGFALLGYSTVTSWNRANRMSRNVCNEVPTYAGHIEGHHTQICTFAHKPFTSTGWYRHREVEISRCLVIRSILPYTNCNWGF